MIRILVGNLCYVKGCEIGRCPVFKSFLQEMCVLKHSENGEYASYGIDGREWVGKYGVKS